MNMAEVKSIQRSQILPLPAGVVGADPEAINKRGEVAGTASVTASLRNAVVWGWTG